MFFYCTFLISKSTSICFQTIDITLNFFILISIYDVLNLKSNDLYTCTTCKPELKNKFVQINLNTVKTYD